MSARILQPQNCPFIVIEDSIPNDLFILKHPPSGKFGCYCHEGVHGLAVFGSEVCAFRFAEYIDLSDMNCLKVSFDESREIAKDRPMPIVSIMLLDDLENPKIHYVR